MRSTQVEVQSLWYVRHGGEVAGPFPQGQIRDFLVLGRIRETDEVSVDQIAWLPLKQVWSPETLTESPVDAEPWLAERRRALKRWLDERSGRDRRHKPMESAGLDARGADRRHGAPATPRRSLPAVSRTRFGPVWLGLSLVTLGILGALWLFPHTIPVPVALRPAAIGCNAPPAPNVRWQNCDLRGISLRNAVISNGVLRFANAPGVDFRGADARYADLESASLAGMNAENAVFFGANLSSADLRNARFKGSDLRYVDLTGSRIDKAQFAEARLGNALWIDGKMCKPASVGRCE